MPYDLGQKARLERAGLTVVEVAGWGTRGDPDYQHAGHVNHHTAGPVAGTAPSLGVVINGRPDLAGPLCNTYGDRTPTLKVYLVAGGRANHAGEGHWGALSGNRSVSGHEEEHSGTAGEPLHPTRLERMVRVAAAQVYGISTPSSVCQHWEWAPLRKVDFTRAWVDPADFRLRVAQRLWLMQHPAPAPSPVPVLHQECEMFFASAKSSVIVWFFEPGRRTLVPSATEGQALAASAGIPYSVAELSDGFIANLSAGRETFQ